MTAKRLVGMVVLPILVGLLVAVALSGDELISAQVWVASAAVFVMAMLLRDFIAVAAVEPARLVIAWSRRRQRRAVHDSRGLQAINVLLATAQSNSRAHANHLRPRLIALAEHYLAIRHGIDLEHQPARAADLLGGVAWLIDPAVNDRTPTLAEIQRFLDVILAQQHMSTTAHGRQRPVMVI